MSNGIKWCAVILLSFLVAGCSSQRLSYVPSAAQFSDRQQAADFVEQAFFEDYGKKFRPQSVLITDKVIILSDGMISEATGFASAAPLGSSAIAVGSSRSVTKDASRRIYLTSIDDVSIYQKRGRSNRFVVIIRGEDGRELGSIRTGSLERAQRFSDALTYLKSMAKP
ncbi:hypothetical protein N5D48_21570 [Pseudomonas sp. GD03858]|uniref:hypothetical protein n=1 Tax=unclassified Pseudomonas TaxID=196821 RepID=UPI00244C22F8|nr:MULTISPECIES: hypothetical protein [unclassified Pseudomonas]MDH0650165.1 hypothetical protein [Pseudomonas sp. GD03867]MDH0665000.1 hypothetical protein [Pseudomonas sp. GD03858]